MKYITLEYNEYRRLESQSKCYEENMELLQGKTIIPNEDYVEYKTLQARVEKAIKYMDNTFNISSVKDMFEIMNKLEEILGGDVDDE